METFLEDTKARDRRRRGPVVGATVTVLLLAGLATVVLRPTATRHGSADLAMPSLRDGGTISLADYRGTPVIVNFFSSWCLFCIAEMPEFEKVHAALGDQVVFVGVAMQDRSESALQLADQTGVTYALADDPSGELFDRLRATGMPTTVFIDRDGTVVERFTGPLSEHALRDRISTHFFA